MKFVITKNTTKKNKIKILNTILAEFFCAVIPSHVGSKGLTTEQKEHFGKEANMILNTDVWKWLKLEMEEVARKRMFDEAQSIDDMVFGKALLYELDVLQLKLIHLTK